MIRRSILLGLLVTFSLFIHAYKQQSLDINVNGQQRNMVVFTPNSLPANSPLFIVTHGMNQSPEYQYDSDKMYLMIDTAKFVIAYLRSDGNTWDTGGTKDQNFVIKTIDEMATRYKIDTDRVYWSGFSMGSMLIHHCIANMQDKIAAFAPTSGIQFSEQPWNNCKKPVNLLEVIAYGDDVFGYEPYGIHAYIENYAKHDKHPNYVKIQGYKPINSSWYNGDLEKWTGGPNGGEVWLYSYNNGGHWPMDLNRHLIWNFCKRFSLHPTQPSIQLTAPVNGLTHLYMSPAGEAEFPDIIVRATAKDPNGKVAKVDFFDGNTLFATKEKMPYSVTLEHPSAGKRTIKAVVTDNDGETASASCQVNYLSVQRMHSFALNTPDVVPIGWTAMSGTQKRTGSNETYADGPRVLHFTNSQRGFEYGLLIQNTLGRAGYGWAKYGIKAASSTVTLFPGRYSLKYKICNWNQPEFSPVTINIEKRSDGQVVATTSYTPTINIGGNTENKFSSVRVQTFSFEIEELDDYLIAIHAADVKGADCVLGQLILQCDEFNTTGIKQTKESYPNTGQTAVFDLSGRRQAQPQRGINIVTTPDGQTHKILKPAP